MKTNKPVQLDMTGEEAEEILYSLSLRYKQMIQLKSTARAYELDELGKKCSRKFERIFGADRNWWERYRDADFRVKITSPKVVYK